jgi:prolyl oligopeptidase
MQFRHGATLGAPTPPVARVIDVTTPPRPAYPDAERLDLVDDLHGRPVPDPYRWLEDAADPRSVAWRAAQDSLLAQERSAWTSRESFAERIEQLMGAGTVSPPYFRGERRFFTRRDPGQQFPVLYTVDPGTTEPRVLIDPIALNADGTTTLDAWQPSKEGDRLAYQLSEGGTEESTLFVMDVATGDTIEGPIDRCRYSPVAWLPGGEAFYYVRRLPPEDLPEAERGFHRRIYLHRVGASVRAR